MRLSRRRLWGGSVMGRHGAGHGDSARLTTVRDGAVALAGTLQLTPWDPELSSAIGVGWAGGV
jgi:hypothetical protein